MDQKKRKALLIAVELGNLTRAAEALGYTQSGLSYLITSLEQEVGFPLLVRSRSGVRPTEDCLTLLPYLRDLERKLQQVEQ
ncbi:MAG: LysR family transcriptional regulator, partial [Ruminiclostridium sp.]|nr:LysR family transcriptional regulator [Ruminiclostridium sp.]